MRQATVFIRQLGNPGAEQVLSPLKNRASKGVRPIASVDELRADVFESDQELDEFLELKVVEQRHGHLALTGGTLSRLPRLM